MPTHVNALAVIAKAPVAGQVKTRLLPALSAAEAAEVSRALLLDQLHHLSAVDFAALYLAFAPEAARASMAALAPAPFRLFAQQGDDLGARMSHVFEYLFAQGHRCVMLIGGDLPPVPLRYFADGFEYLADAGGRVILGPSRDGGYYLVGMNHPTPEIFVAMTWSHERVLAQTTARLGQLNIDCRLLPQWFDVDTIDDLRDMERRLPLECAVAMKRTRESLRRIDFNQWPPRAGT